MLLLPLHTPTLKMGDDLADVILSGAKDLLYGEMQAGDIVVLSSKAVATVEGAMIDLRTMTPSPRARALARTMERSPQFCEAMLMELERLNGTILWTVPGAALTAVRPMQSGNVTPSSSPRSGERTEVVVASAGLDESNAPEGFAVGWPRDPIASVARLRKELEKQIRGKKNVRNKKNTTAIRLSYSSYSSHSSPPSRLALILSDSTCMPRRHGVTAFALAVSGLDPLQTKGKTDLFGKPLLITTEAVADQLATAANFLMGNAGQSVPAVIIRNHGLELSDWEGWVPGIEPEKDLFRDTLK